MSTLAKISSSVSNIDTAKITSSLSDSISSAVQKIDTSAITDAIKKTSSGITSATTTVTKKTATKKLKTTMYTNNLLYYLTNARKLNH